MALLMTTTGWAAALAWAIADASAASTPGVPVGGVGATWWLGAAAVGAGSALLIIIPAWLLQARTQPPREREVEPQPAQPPPEPSLLAASLAHDCNNLVSIARLNALWLERNLHDEESLATVRDLQAAVTRLAELVGKLKDLPLGDLPTRSRDVDLCALIREEVTLIRRHERITGCTLALSIDGPVSARVNTQELQRITTNLMLNAADAGGGKGVVEICVREEAGNAILEVHDDGPGVPPSLRRLIFSPGYTTKAGGSGLGLASVQACVDSLHGRIEVTESPLGGACFRVLLPAIPHHEVIPARVPLRSA